jgi:hypothetical protein
VLHGQLIVPVYFFSSFQQLLTRFVLEIAKAVCQSNPISIPACIEADVTQRKAVPLAAKTVAASINFRQ